MNEDQLVFVDEDGNEVLCDILFTFELEEYGKKYVVFKRVGDEPDEDGLQEVGVASYVPDSENEGIGELFPIEDEEEFAKVEEVLMAYDDECCCDDCEDECHDGCCCHHHDE